MRGDRSLTLRHLQRSGLPLRDDSAEVLKHVARLWGFEVKLESVNATGGVTQRMSAAGPKNHY